MEAEDHVTEAPAVARLASITGIDLGGVLRAAERSQALLDRLTDACEALALPDGVAVVVTGSVGRLEVTASSDVDFVVASVWEEATEEHAAAVAEAITALGYDPPRRDGPLGRPAHAKRLAALPGRDAESNAEQRLAALPGHEAETNADFTLRLLLLLESRAVTAPRVRTRLVAALLDTYLRDHTSRAPPRFLLNDVVRYWRTLCVDFEGKMAVRHEQGWVIRNAKLRTLRKLLFAGGLVPILECHVREGREADPFLLERLALSPSARIAAAAIAWGAPEAGASALSAYGRMLDLLDDPERRDILESLPKAGHETHPLWLEVADIGRQFQRGLERLLFETPLQVPARSYGVF